MHPRPSHPPHTIHPSLFIDHLDALIDHGYVPISISDLVIAITIDAPVPTRSVLVTFDQGLGSFHDYALPALRRRDMPSTVFVTTGFVGRESRAHGGVTFDERAAMTWAQLRDLANEDVVIGSNGHSHRPLDVMNRWDAGEDLALSRSLLEHQLSRSVDIAAYPAGLASSTTRAAAARVGYRAGCMLSGGVASNYQDLYELSRIPIHGHMRPEVLLAHLSMAARRRPARREPLRAKTHRAVRWMIRSG